MIYSIGKDEEMIHWFLELDCVTGSLVLQGKRGTGTWTVLEVTKDGYLRRDKGCGALWIKTDAEGRIEEET